MTNAQGQAEQQGTGCTEAREGIDVLVTLSRKHEKRLSRLAVRLDVHDRRFERMDQRFDEVGRLFRQAGKRFDQIDDRFIQVEQRLDFISGQLTELAHGLTS